MKVDKDKSKRRKNIQGQHEIKGSKIRYSNLEKNGFRKYVFLKERLSRCVKGPSQQQHVKIQKLPAPNRDSKNIKQQNDETTHKN